MAEPFPGGSRFIQLKRVELKHLPDKLNGPYILLLHNCVVSGAINDQQMPIVFFSGLHFKNEHGPVVQLSTAIGTSLRRLKFTLQFLDSRDSVLVDKLELAFELQFFG